MQTQFRKTRSIIADAFSRKPDDPVVVECANQVVEFLTGKTPIQRKDVLDGWLKMDSVHEAEMKEVTEILHTFERELRRADDLAGSPDWQDFARGFIQRELTKGHDYHTWLKWYRTDPIRMEWAWKVTPATVRSRWLMAFDNIPAQKLPSGV